MTLPRLLLVVLVLTALAALAAGVVGVVEGRPSVVGIPERSDAARAPFPGDGQPGGGAGPGRNAASARGGAGGAARLGRTPCRGVGGG